MQAVEIISFHDKYLVDVESLLKDNPDIFSNDDYRLYRDNLLAYLLQKPDKKKAGVFLLMIDKHVAGMIMYEKVEASQDYYRIQWLAIRPGQQHKGYGTQLIKHVFKTIKEIGGKHVYVETSNEKYNHNAKHFYEKVGFKRMGVLPNFYSPPKNRKRQDDDVIYYKSL